MRDKEMGGWGEKVKRSPRSDPQEKCALTTEARAKLDGHLPPEPRAWAVPRSPELQAIPALFSAAACFAQNLSTKKPPRSKIRSPRARGRLGDPLAEALSPAPRRPGGSQGAAGRGDASVRPLPKCFRTCHPPSRSIFFSRRGGRTRAKRTREDRRAGLAAAGRLAGSGARPGPAAPRPLGRPPPLRRYCSRAAPARRALPPPPPGGGYG